jgi:hypothetical protein
MEREEKKVAKVSSCDFRHFVNLFLFIYQMGTCCVYVVFVASNLQNVSEQNHVRDACQKFTFSPPDRRVLLFGQVAKLP